MHSVYYQYMYRFILRILMIRTDSFCIFSVYKQIHSAYFQYTNRFIMCIPFKDLPCSVYFPYRYRFLCVLSVYEQIYSAYSWYTYRFVLYYFALALPKKRFLMSIRIRGGMTFEFRYLGKFEFILEYYLGYESGDQKGAYEE
jgi:hypothetical protein